MNYIIVEGFEVEGPAQDINYEMAEADRDYKIEVAEDEDDSTNYNHSYFSRKRNLGWLWSPPSIL